MKRYAITDPLYYGSDASTVVSTTRRVIEVGVDYLCFRDKRSKNRSELAKSFAFTCKQSGFERFLFNGSIDLAQQHGAYGVHLRATQFEEIDKAKSLGLFTVVSTHSEAEIEKASAFGADAVTFSPIFATPNKGAPKGVQRLREVVQKYGEQLKIFALGGITSTLHVKEIEQASPYGFASIRYFI